MCAAEEEEGRERGGRGEGEGRERGGEGRERGEEEREGGGKDGGRVGLRQPLRKDNKGFSHSLSIGF